MAEAFLPNPDNKEQVNHRDCNTANNCLDNLEWVTPKENVAHRVYVGNVRKEFEAVCLALA